MDIYELLTSFLKSATNRRLRLHSQPADPHYNYNADPDSISTRFRNFICHVSKKSCASLIEYSRCTNGQDLLDMQYDFFQGSTGDDALCAFCCTCCVSVQVILFIRAHGLMRNHVIKLSWYIYGSRFIMDNVEESGL